MQAFHEYKLKTTQYNMSVNLLFTFRYFGVHFLNKMLNIETDGPKTQSVEHGRTFLMIPHVDFVWFWKEDHR